ncbi:MAG: tetratricopeptide repeat protein [Caulobacter sp.]|nr:tetratricopeptide repeat protein [Caulobacter sp.]
MKLRHALPALAPLAFAAAVAALAAPAAAKPAKTEAPTSDVAFGDSDRGSSYGLFLAGQAAMKNGRNELALDYFDRATAADIDADGQTISARAFIAAVFAGDVPRAARLAPGEEAGVNLQRLGALEKVVDALADGRAGEARDILASGAVTMPHRPVAALLAPWVAAAAGDKEGAVARPDLRGDRLVEVFGQLGQAQLFERARRYDEAETDYMALTSLGDAGLLFILDHGAFLERRGRRADAVALYDRALQQAPGDSGLLTARQRAARRGKAPPLPTLREGAARAFLPFATAMAGERQSEMALAYVRMSLYLDPTREDTRVLLGDVLGALDDADGAREAYASIPSGSPYYASARAKLAWSYQSAKDADRGLGMARQAYEAYPDDRDAAVTYADLLRANGRFAESAEVLDGVISRAGGEPDWRLLYMRGIALERSGQWPAAEKDLMAALAQQPNEPELLNYLGYAWIDRGERLAEAMDMVKRAVAANPRSGAMVDSLGWAYFRIGDFRRAVEKLEEAVLLSPADPEINSHLGDAYWRVGRQIEARFQWSRTLTLDPPAEIKADAETKLKAGLPPVAASAVAAN